VSQRIDFGYSHVWSWGHAVLAALLLGAGAACQLLELRAWIVYPLVAVGAWAAAGALVMLLGVRQTRPLELPTAEFLPAGEGRVLDMGCGAGRATLMVAKARPGASVTALDDFSASYIRDHGEERTLRNLEIAGVQDRVEIEKGDMRALPFGDDEFDGIVSTYAIDHLGSDIPKALAEARRVLRKGGQVLFMVIVPNLWMSIAWGPLVWLHMPGRRTWRRMLADAGFGLEAEGSARATAWFLAG
jgi:SAM-dependent methyltransferase